MSKVKRSILSAVCIALCVVLPMAFHAIPNGGTVYSPMHIPVLLCGLVCGGGYGVLCALAGPLLSALITGMPPIAVLPVMLAECVCYGGVSGLLMARLRTEKVFADLYISMLAAMLIGRIAGGAARALIFAPGAVTLAAWATGYFVTALPGVIIQLVLVPSIVYALQRARLIPQRYYKLSPAKEQENG